MKNIRIKNQTSTVIGPTKLIGCDVVATDLRAGAALIIAGIEAKGTTELYNLNHIDRGYEKIENQLSSIGADIKRINDEKAE